VNQHVNARSAVLLDMDTGSILFEQNADYVIAPASITKVLTLYLIFEAIKQGHVSLSDKVEVSKRAASTGGSRMGLRAGTVVPMEELIKGIAVVSGNDACVAAAEHISGSVERFVKKMNAKARELGMTRSRFMTPNGLPAEGQVTTARDIARLSVAYLRRFPESLTIHSMQEYTYRTHTHHNANKLLGKCPGVDGLKTGFVCSSGYNIAATARRNHTRILAVVMGARNPWVRCSEAEKLIEAGFHETGAPYNELKCATGTTPAVGRGARTQTDEGACGIKKAGVKRAGKHNKLAAHDSAKPSASKRQAWNHKKKADKIAGKSTVKNTGKSTAKNGKTSSRNASAKNEPAKAASEKKYAAAKSGAATAKKAGTAKAKSAKHHKEESKTAVRKKNNKAVPHADAVKKKAKG
jgi:D-alanyl-D-alanine carboxypeptidase (penicillin-binding protein 5/6)